MVQYPVLSGHLRTGLRPKATFTVPSRARSLHDIVAASVRGQKAYRSISYWLVNAILLCIYFSSVFWLWVQFFQEEDSNMAKLKQLLTLIYEDKSTFLLKCNCNWILITSWSVYEVSVRKKQENGVAKKTKSIRQPQMKDDKAFYGFTTGFKCWISQKYLKIVNMKYLVLSVSIDQQYCN